MFDSEYFRTALQTDIDTIGGDASVAVHLIGGRTHRLRTVIAVHAGYVTTEAYQLRSEGPIREPRWQEEVGAGASPYPIERVVIPYESIVDVTITAVRGAGSSGGIGFAGA